MKKLKALVGGNNKAQEEARQGLEREQLRNIMINEVYVELAPSTGHNKPYSYGRNLVESPAANFGKDPDRPYAGIQYFPVQMEGMVKEFMIGNAWLNLDENVDSQRMIKELDKFISLGNCFGSLEFNLVIRTFYGSWALLSSRINKLIQKDSMWASFLVSAMCYKVNTSYSKSVLDAQRQVLSVILGMNPGLGKTGDIDLLMSPHILCKLPGRVSLRKSSTDKYLSSEFVVCWRFEESKNSVRHLEKMVMEGNCFHLLPLLYQLPVRIASAQVSHMNWIQLKNGSYDIDLSLESRNVPGNSSNSSDFTRKQLKKIFGNYDKKDPFIRISDWIKVCGLHEPSFHSFLLKLGYKSILRNDRRAEEENLLWRDWPSNLAQTIFTIDEMAMFLEDGGEAVLLKVLTDYKGKQYSSYDKLNLLSVLFEDWSIPSLCSGSLLSKVFYKFWLIVAKAFGCDKSENRAGLAAVASLNDFELLRATISEVSNKTILGHLVFAPYQPPSKSESHKPPFTPSALWIAIKNRNFPMIELISDHFNLYQPAANGGLLIPKVVNLIFDSFYYKCDMNSSKELDSIYLMLQNKIKSA